VARPAVIGLLARLGGTARLDAQTARLRRSGARGVAAARMTPGIRIVAIAASALAAIPAPAFLIGLIVGNGLFIAAHFALGLVLGEPVLRIVGGALGPIAAAVVALAVVGALGWILVSRRRGRRAALPRVAAWADACCPACIAAAVATG
jgi:membrane protein DedA with SNARE-associated domain